MNLNRLYNIFGKKAPLSRKEISDYGTTSDPSLKHSIEMKDAADPFDADAMEGWDALNYNVGSMSKLDRKFMKSSSTGWFIGGSAVLVATIVVVFFYTSPGKETPTDAPAPKHLTGLLEDQQVTLEQTDVAMPDSITVFENAPKHQRIEVKKMKQEFQEMKSNYEVQLPPRVEILGLDKIRITPRNVTPEIIREHKTAAEIYLHELKLVDYTKYRSKPTVTAKQMVLTGTPANLEGDHSADFTPEYKDSEIPYIEYLSKTIGRFSNGSYKNALVRFDVILQSYPDDVNANFYSGLCLYNMKQYESAIDRFLKCIAGPYSNFDEEAQWMTALSYEKLGRKTQAEEYFVKIIEQGGYYKKQASAKMKR